MTNEIPLKQRLIEGALDFIRFNASSVALWVVCVVIAGISNWSGTHNNYFVVMLGGDAGRHFMGNIGRAIHDIISFAGPLLSVIAGGVACLFHCYGFGSLLMSIFPRSKGEDES